MRTETEEDIYSLVEAVMHENVEPKKYENNEAVCNALIESLLIPKGERGEQVRQLFLETEHGKQYLEVLRDTQKKDALISSVARICQKYGEKSQAGDERSFLSGLVKHADGTGLSRTVNTALSLFFSSQCNFSNHLLEMDDKQIALFCLIKKMRVLRGETDIYFDVSDTYFNCTVEEAKTILRDIVQDSPIQININESTLNVDNREGYKVLLTSDAPLTLNITEKSAYFDELDYHFIVQLLKNKSHVGLECNLINYGEHDFGQKINIEIMKALPNVKFTIIDDIADWGTKGGSWRPNSDRFYKKFAHDLHRKYALTGTGVVMEPARQKRSIHSLFVRKSEQRHDTASGVENQRKHRQ